MHAADFKAPAPEGEKGIGKLRVWESNGLGRLRVSRAIGEGSRTQQADHKSSRSDALWHIHEVSIANVSEADLG